MKPPPSTLESLEARTAPASLLSPTTLTYQDVDGDNVTVKFNKPILTDLATANAIFTFSPAGIGGPGSAQQQLQLIQLNSPAFDAAAGAGISIVATRSATNGGDGLVHVSSIRAEIDLGAGVSMAALGAFGGADAYGFVAPQIGSLRLGATPFPLTVETDDADANDPLLLVGADRRPAGA